MGSLCVLTGGALPAGATAETSATGGAVGAVASDYQPALRPPLK